MYEGVYVKRRSGDVFGRQSDIWEDILRNWIKMIVRYCNHLEGAEAPYYFNERANVGLLAAAAWQSGCVALEEFGIDKIGSENVRRNGRADLWIGAGEESYWLEAKLRWLNLHCNQEKLKKQNIHSESAAKELNVYRHEHRIAVTFIVPSSSSENEKSREEEIQNFSNRIKCSKSLPCDAKAWVFPPSVRSLKGSDGKFYPGVVVLLNRIKWPRTSIS